MNLGIPDCIIAIENHFHLVELKVAQPNGRVRISPHQIAFHNAHKGCPTWIFVQYNKGRKIHLLVYEGWKAYTLVDLGILLPPDHEQKYPLDWNKVEKHLTMFKN